MIKKPKCIILLPCILSLSPFFQQDNTLVAQDTCTVNDDCLNAIFINSVITDVSFVCEDGCNLYASPDSLVSGCQMGDFPTVWYHLELDGEAAVMNIEVYSPDFESPVISVFRPVTGCADLEQVYLTNGNLSCIIGSDGVAKAIGTSVDAGGQYYIAVSSLLSIGGDFEICISTLSTGSACVLSRDLEIVSRSNGGPLEGPFDPGETVSICMNVNSYTAANNGCQWFQGIVPVFGNGWDPSAFDTLGQPVNTTVNGSAIGTAGNGIYSTATWDWFTDVDYHHAHPTYTIADLDGNGRLDMCNSTYEIDCPHQGLTAACCNPCWGTPLGVILPPGWFAYGINGSCGTPGPPIRVDWGDGNTCGGGMGPWSFCFDLITRDVPDCMGDSTNRDLSLGFFTFADGEVGAWTGDQSVCSYDQPVKLSLKAKCGRVSEIPEVVLPTLCPADTFRFQIDEPHVGHWDWNISPFWAVPYVTNQGQNGFTIEAPLSNFTGDTVDIKGILIGYETGSMDIVLKKFKFKLTDMEQCGIVSVDESKAEDQQIKLYPMPAAEAIWLEWAVDLHQDAIIDICDSRGVRIKRIPVSPFEGNRSRIDMKDVLPGVYFIQFGNEAFRHVSRLVKL
jgi:hypothetical protein